jgi:hypothetical protein
MTVLLVLSQLLFLSYDCGLIIGCSSVTVVFIRTSLIGNIMKLHFTLHSMLTLMLIVVWKKLSNLTLCMDWVISLQILHVLGMYQYRFWLWLMIPTLMLFLCVLWGHMLDSHMGGSVFTLVARPQLQLFDSRVEKFVLYSWVINVIRYLYCPWP